MKPCCQESANLHTEPRDPKRPDVLVKRCQSCGSRHIEFAVDPGRLGVFGASL
jgi:hypothetical protein